MSSRKGTPSDRFLFWRTDFVGVAMIVSGLFLVLVNFNLVPASSFVLPRFLGILFFLIGLLFLFFSGAGSWLTWFVIPAGAFITFGLATLVLGLNRFFSLESACLISLGFGLTFLTLFYTRTGDWWVLIPSGVFIGLAAWGTVGSRSPILGWHPVEVLFFLGLSFLVIYLIAVQKRRMRWSLLVGTIIVGASFLYLLGILVAHWSILWPVVLLLAGCLIPVIILLAERRRGA